MGSSPAKGYTNVLLSYIQDRMDQDLLTFAQQNLKKNQEIGDLITDILSVFHRDENGNLVLGSWQIKRCLTETGLIYFNAKTNKDHPKKDIVPYLVQTVEPYYIPLTNGTGDPIDKAAGVETFAVTIKPKPGSKGRSFFTAYEKLPAGTNFKFQFTVDEEYMNPNLAKWWLEKAGIVGTYAYRERFGKFVIKDVAFN
jgi:hypothetical protein